MLDRYFKPLGVGQIAGGNSVMAKIKARTHVGSIYGMIELRGYLTDEQNGKSDGQPVLVIEEVVGDFPHCFESLLGVYAPHDIIEGVRRPEMAPNVLQTYPRPANFVPIHLTKPPTSKEEIKLADRAFVESFTDNSGFRPGSETVAWLYGEPARQMFIHPNA
jgi:hypothetical protein